MSPFEALAVAAWIVPIALAARLRPRLHRGTPLARPEARRLCLDALRFDGDGPVIDLEPA